MLYWIHTLLVGLVVWLIWRSRQKPIGFPRGYYGVPILGVLPFLSDNPAETFTKWTRKLGTVFYVQMGMKNMVVLNDFSSINECLVNQGKYTSDRADLRLYRDTRNAEGLLLQKYAKKYRTTKNIVLNSLKGFGVGRDEIEDKLHEELKHITQELSDKNGTAFNTKDLMYLATASVISSVTFGKRLEYDDPKLLQMLEALEAIYNNQRDSDLLGLMMFVPQFRYFPFFSGAFNRLYRTYFEREKIFEEFYKNHETTLDENETRDIIDQFLLDQKDDPRNPAYEKSQVIQVITDLFDAGVDTAATTLQFAFLYLAKNPQFQTKLASEISNVIGSSLPLMSHSEELPLTCSFIDEVLRHRTLVPLSVFHKTAKDIKLYDFSIPKDTVLVPNIWAAHRDPKIFEDPDQFIPERFIKNGKYYKSKYLIPFCIGPRKCPGFQLAEKELFVFLCGILQKFEIRKDEQSPLPSFEDGIFGIVYFPKKFKIKFCMR